MGNLAARKGDLGASAARLRPATAYDAVRLVLGPLLLVAAALKAHQLATEPVLGTGLLDSRWVLIAAVEFELFFGLWLLAGLLPRLSWAAAVVCFGLFACVSLDKALSGAASCGCFGRVEVSPWHTSALDAASVLALLLWRPSGVKSSAWLPSRAVMLRGTVVFLVWLSVGIPAGVAMGGYQPTLLGEDGVLLGQGNLVILEPEKWVGKRFPLLPFIEDIPGGLKQAERPLRERLAEGEWLVVLYHHDCPKCREAMPRYEQLARQSSTDPTSPRVALVEVPPYGEVSSVRLSAHAPCARGLLSREKKWFVETPMEVSVIDRVVGWAFPENGLAR